MKWIYIAAMTYMSVSGGPFGIEEVLHHAPLYQSIVIVLLGAALHMVPTGIMTYEMVRRYDQYEAKGGTIGWVKQTMGVNAGVFNAVFSIADTAVDNAIYPVIVKDNLGIDGAIVPIVTCCMCAILNWKDTTFTGQITLLQTVVILSPFVFLLLKTPIDNDMYIDSRTYNMPLVWENYQRALMIVIWSYSGFDMCASYIYSFKANMSDIRLGFGVAAFVSVVSYLLAICCGTYYIHDRDTWIDGSWSYIGELYFGQTGKTWVQMASVISSVSTLCVELCATAHLWVGLVELKAAPEVFQNVKLNLVLNTLITIYLSTTQTFETLVDISALLNVSTIIFESIAWLKTFGGGKYMWRAITAVLLIAVNICITACVSQTCIISLGGVFSLAVTWIAARTIALRIASIRKRSLSTSSLVHSRP